jgi:hypothetical protein
MQLHVAFVAEVSWSVSMQLSLAAAQSTSAALAQLLAVECSAWSAPTRPQHRTCTTASAHRRSIKPC